MYFAELDDGSVKFDEERGSRGGRYLYMEEEGELVPLASRGTAEKIREGGGTRNYEITLDREVFEDEKTIYALGTSNSGLFHPRKYKLRIEKGELVSEKVDSEEWNLQELEFREIGNERFWLTSYKNSVFPMVELVDEICQDNNFNFRPSKKARRTMETLRNPEKSLYISLMFNTSRSRIRSLKQKIQRIRVICTFFGR
ncbi:hypothetical protein AKJ62_03725 [candidate division MSBL1 archaeon SCGC-AAA259D14]|uniref:Uncharacterized protein n=1 Tax=candidate division MSBL1 archaeon SCGC-AAA259D14 TaxID=1698261 RepID=A0A133U4L1_9EURY|nr:hypothetical protein AKJ62_03725 [candidate division MSBL1 archaeon SCGC-AAA259D14]